MKKFSGYKETEVHDFIQYDKLNLGPHYCKITDVREITMQGQSGPYSFLQVNIDTTDKDAQPQFYLKRYKQDVDQDAQTAKWRGVYRVFIPDDDGSEKDNKKKEMFKSFITTIEKSNPGYDWEKTNWDEKTLIGKQFIGVFALKEFQNDMGKVITFTECRFVRSLENDIEKIPIPKVRLLDGTLMEYEDYLEREENQKEQEGKFKENVIDEDDDDSLPF